MTWNWQQPDWPFFSWDSARLAQAESRFLVAGGTTLGLLRALPPDDTRIGTVGTVEALTSEAITTSEIEGELLDRESVRSSIRRRLGIDPGGPTRRGRAAEEGIADLMVDVHRNVATPLDHETMFRWHEMIVRGHPEVQERGVYRKHADAMQVVSGRLDRPSVHFEAPPSARVRKEMDVFVEWFNASAPPWTSASSATASWATASSATALPATALPVSTPPVPAVVSRRPGTTSTLPALTRAGIAHLYFVSIHPFEDGNGRIARALIEKVLGQALGHTALTALSTVILHRRNEYYAELEASNKANEVTRWLAWFAGVVLEAQLRGQSLVEFVLETTRLLDRVRGMVNERQEKALLRMMREGPSGFEGGLSAANYRSITGATTATTTRDLADLVDKGALVRTGERRHARYQLAVALRETPRVTVGESGEVVVAS